MLRVGFVGLGVMGASMSKNLLKKGFPLTVYTRTQAKADSVLALGATWASTPKEVALKSDLVISMVGYPKDVEEVVLNPKTGILSGLSRSAIFADMTTSKPSLAVLIAQAAKAIGVDALDAPVSGGDVGARNATLSIMVGGDEAAFNKAKPVFEALGTNIRYMGAAGSGQHTKMTNQILIASGMIGLVEGLLYAHKAGLDVNLVLQAVSAGAAGSWSLSNYGPRILSGDLKPGFFVNHFIKDLEIALEESHRMGLELPGLALAEKLYKTLKALGHGEKGTHSLIIALAELNKTDWPGQGK